VSFAICELDVIGSAGGSNFLLCRARELWLRGADWLHFTEATAAAGASEAQDNNTYGT
jgi:hypothetical protein